MIDSGEAKNRTDLVMKLVISKVHVSRVLSLLKLVDELIEAVVSLGNPMPSGTVIERMLRKCLNSTELFNAVLSCLSNYNVDRADDFWQTGDHCLHYYVNIPVNAETFGNRELEFGKTDRLCMLSSVFVYLLLNPVL
jgi:hypothetical protein